jgi:hypothetical protein
LRTAKDFLAKNVLDKAFFLIEGHLPPARVHAARPAKKNAGTVKKVGSGEKSQKNSGQGTGNREQGTVDSQRLRAE